MRNKTYRCFYSGVGHVHGGSREDLEDGTDEDPTRAKYKPDLGIHLLLRTQFTFCMYEYEYYNIITSVQIKFYLQN